MNQAKLTPKPDLTLLAVVVPKEAEKFQAYDYNGVHDPTLLYRVNKVVFKIDLKLSRNHHPLIKMMGGNQRYNLTIIGLLSNITEEQAKEIVPFTECYGATFFTNYMNKRGFKRNGVDSLQSLIESSGLTYTNEEDVLLIKVKLI